MKGDAEKKSIEGRTDDLKQKKRTRVTENEIPPELTKSVSNWRRKGVQWTSIFFSLLVVGTEWTIGRRFHRPEK